MEMIIGESTPSRVFEVKPTKRNTAVMPLSYVYTAVMPLYYVYIARWCTVSTLYLSGQASALCYSNNGLDYATKKM